MKNTSLLQRTRAGLSRIIGGKPLQVRKFQAARIDRLSAGWITTDQSINQELRSDLNLLRTRGRELAQNNDYASKFVGMVKTNIIGPAGIRLQVRVEDSPGKPDRLANAAIEAGWADWSKACDITGKQSLRDLCETLVGGMPADGEFLVRVVLGSAARNKYGIALQVVDVDRIDTTYNTTVGTNGNQVVMGIEVDAYRRPVAIHLFESHPNDGVATSRKRIRLDINETLHCFKVERAEQLRGIPWMAPGMLSLHHLGNFKLSALLAAEHGANHFGFFTTPDGQSPIGNESGGEMISTSQPGTYDTLPAGVSFQAHESKYPNEVFGPFVKTTLQRIASGWRVAYHSLANDLEGVSYSSIRSGSLEERDRWASDQQWFVDAFMEPVFQMWLQAALFMGALTMPNGSALPASKRDKFAKHEWQPRRWEWVDPKGDMEAKILAVKAGLMAPQDLAAAMGYDFDDTLASIALAQQLAKQLGVSLPAYDAMPGAVSAPEPVTKSENEFSTRSFEMFSTAIANMATRESVQPVINNNFTMPEQRFETHNHVAPAQVEVRNQIDVPETAITVEAHMPVAERSDPAPITVINQVQPAPVTVNNAFASKAVQTVQRDKNDEIISTTTSFTP